MMEVCVYGLGLSGFWASLAAACGGFRVTVCDEGVSPSLRERADQLDSMAPGGVRVVLGTLLRPDMFDIIVKSPGIPMRHPRIEEAVSAGVPVVDEVEFAARFMPFELMRKGLFITGTNGKTTTCSMVSHVLRRAGFSVFTGGNFGVPLSRYVVEGESADFLVLELSSFQIEGLRSAVARGGAILNVDADHIDVHGSFGRYLAAKLKLAEHVADFCLVNADDPNLRLPGALGFSMKGRAFCFLKDGELFVDGRRCGSLEALGRRVVLDAENVLAAVGVCALCGVDPSFALDSLRSFEFPRFRLEFVGEVMGRRFYNDSKATNPHAVLRALRAFEGEQVVLVMGGSDKDMDFSVLLSLLRDRVKRLVLYGEAARRIASQLDGFDAVLVWDFGDAFKAAFDASSPGDVVLLSPGCASFDQFSSYVERGEAFNRLVEGLRCGG